MSHGPPMSFVGWQGKVKQIDHGTQMMQAPVRIHTYARAPAESMYDLYTWQGVSMRKG